MSLPVSQYEAILAEVRGLRRKAQRVQQLARPLIGSNSQNDKPLDYTMESLLLNRQHDRSNSLDYERGSTSDQDHLSSEDELKLGRSKERSIRSTGQMSVSSEPVTRVTEQAHVESMYHGAWPHVERANMWNSEPTSLGESGTHQRKDLSGISCQNDVSSVMSFASSSGGVPIDRVLCSPDRKWSSQQLEAKMDVVNSLLSMLGSQEHVDMGETLLALSTCPESCLAMRQSGCIPLLVQLVQSDKDSDTRKKASQALYNLVNSQPDEKIRKREIRIMKLLEDSRKYIECLKYNLIYELEKSATATSEQSEEDGDTHPVQTIAHLMKLSFDEGHRQAICQLGGIHTIATLVETEHSMHGSSMQDSHCVLMRRYACMALTNLTFGDSGNKTLLCSFRDFMRALIVQLQSPSDELRQVTASVLRNLSWRADSTSKEILREVGSVTGLMKAAMLQNKENTLKSILSALWNLSAHCTENKSEICAVEGGLGFLVNMLTYKTPSKSLAIIENAGGILRNISSQIAVRDDYREILRKHNCLHILLDQLKSPSLTIVSNACGTLWNLSAKNTQDQDALWQIGAPAMLRSLNHSKHKMIAMGSSAALKNLLSCRPQQHLMQKIDSTALSLNLPELPTLGARKQKALMHDLDHTLSETYENIDKDSPVKSNAESNVDISNFIHGSRSKTRSRSPDDLANTFASLNLNEPSTSYAIDVRHKTQIGQGYGGSSLPYVPQPTRRSNPASFLPVRTTFSDHTYEDNTPEQPIDYSRKYSETTVDKQRKPVTSTEIAQNENDRKSTLSYAEKKDSDSFNIGYTETDLDQPTDYSLRYAEDDSDSDICNKMTKQEYVQDTVKTYYTEGTPYETPFVFSNATSMSDLRNVGNTDEKHEIDNDIQKNNDKKDNKEIKNVDEKDRCSTEDISEMDNVQIKQEKSEFSSGMMSPEKPVNYCEEGTPGYFSRVSSFGSGLDSIPANETVIKKKVKDEANVNESSSSAQKLEKNTNEKMSTTPKAANETKVVKFEQVVNYAEQTPLMFSRSSSLASLDSIEQHSIHDDRSSVVSDFSRLTSGIVSPSELPDSPTQTVPSSPRSSKQKLEFPSSSKQSRHSLENKQRHQQKSSVFEDNITKFKEESTPIQFSTATSLSSLTIDDHDDGENTDSATKTPDSNAQLPSVSSVLDTSNVEKYEPQVDQHEKKDNEKEKETSGSDDLNDDSEGDDDILAACISDGMQSNISVPTASSTPTKLPISTYKYQPAKIPSNSTGIPMMRRTPPRHIPFRNPNVIEDQPKSYFTEDTPAQLSVTGSNSNLSTLSIPNDNKSKGGDFSDDSSNLSGDNDNILEACIRSAMPKCRNDIKDDDKSKVGEFSDDSSNLSGDNDNILNECIQSAMPKSKEDIKESNSNLRNLPIRYANKSKVGDFSDDSSNLSGENDGILEECIQSAMPNSKKDVKVTVSQPKLPIISVVPRRTMQPFKHHPPQMHSQLGDQMPTSSIARKSDESLKMPQSYKQIAFEKINSKRQKGYDSQETRLKDRDRRETSLPPYLSMRDEIANYDVEDSPCHFSLRSSLSDLTVDGSVAGLKASVKTHNLIPKEESNVAGPSRKPLLSETSNSCNESHESNKLHRKESFSSLSSLASNEGDQALLEECIYSGMPTDKHEEALLNECIQAGMASSRSSSRNVDLVSSVRQNPNALRPFQRDDFLVRNPTTTSDASNKSKNVNVASVAGSTVVMQPPVNEQRPEITTKAAGVEDGPALERSDKNDIEKVGNSEQAVTIQSPQLESMDARIGTRPVADMLPGRFLHSDENFLTDQTKSGSSKSVSQFLEGSFENDFTFSNSDNCVNLDNVFTKSCEESGNLVDNRMLDPDAMIESLDRFTAELVSQASHLNKEKSSQLDKQEKSKLSNNDDNTWNDDTSHNELTFPTMSGSAPNVITFESEQDEISNIDVLDGIDNQNEGISNDFSSVNTNTMTESTLIAIEATKLVTVFKKEAEMSQSTISAKSLDLDSIKPPSQLNSLTNSAIGLEKGVPRSPKLVSRKKSLPGSLLVKRALSNSLHHSSSLESLDTNPPSNMMHIGDMDNSITSIASLPREGSDVHPEFVINGVTGKISQDCNPHPIFNVKQQFIPSDLNSFNVDLELVNPPSIFNDITDMCNSLADVATEVIGTETSIFEDCYTQFVDNTYVDNTLQHDTAEFSDANSVTPIHTDLSSAENTPKRTSKPLAKNMMTKQRRNMARDRYKTYVVAAEKVMQESIELETKAREVESNLDDTNEPSSDHYKTVNDNTEPLDSTSEVYYTYTVKTSKLTPKERRKMDRSRFETQVLDQSTILQTSVDMAKTEHIVESRSSSASSSPTRSKLSIRRNFLQKRLENKERFKTQTLSESSFGSPEILSASPPCDNNDIHYLVEKEANLVLKTIRDSKFLQDEMLDSETLSLVSNDEDSEHNSGGSMNYRTYHKSWSLKKPDTPVISSEANVHHEEENPPATQIISSNNLVTEVTLDHHTMPQEPERVLIGSVSPEQNYDEENDIEKVIGKPKIVKPVNPTIEYSEEVENEEQPKGIRGRRKPLYSKTNLSNKMAPKTIKPAKTMASNNLVKNITSSIKSGTSLKNVVNSRERMATLKPPVHSQVKSSGYGYTRNSNNLTTPSRSAVNSRSNSRNNSPKNSPKHTAKGTPPLERQGTFTKDDSPSSSSPKTPTKLPTPPSKIPSFARQIARAVTSKIPTNNPSTPNRLNLSNLPAKSASADRSNKNTRTYNRSTSADSRDSAKKIQPSSSTQSLKNELKTSNGALRKSGIPSPAQRSNSNASITSNGSVKKQVTSKIASLWKKVEESKAKQQPISDRRVWIQNKNEPDPPKLISNTFENKNVNSPSVMDGNDITAEPNMVTVAPHSTY